MGSDGLTSNFWTAAVAALALLVAVALRAVTSGRVEIKLNDILVALAAAFLVLFLAGRIDKFAVTRDGITIEPAKQAILSAAAAPISQQVLPLPIVPFEEALKGGPDLIQSLL